MSGGETFFASLRPVPRVSEMSPVELPKRAIAANHTSHVGRRTTIGSPTTL